MLEVAVVEEAINQQSVKMVKSVDLAEVVEVWTAFLAPVQDLLEVLTLAVEAVVLVVKHLQQQFSDTTVDLELLSFVTSFE
jgi:hypothetical protein